MAALESQIIEPQELIPICDYQFTGDTATVENKRRIVEGYRLKASIYHAALYARVHRATVYRYMDSDPEFAQAMEDSFEDAADVAESSVYERAIGRNCKPDSLLAMFWLKAHRPKYRDRVSIDVESVREEIQQRMAQVNISDLRQLPAIASEFLGTETLGIQHFAPQPEQIEKEGDSTPLHNLPSE